MLSIKSKAFVIKHNKAIWSNMSPFEQLYLLSSEEITSIEAVKK